jgi:hypothetical protein
MFLGDNISELELHGLKTNNFKKIITFVDIIKKADRNDLIVTGCNKTLYFNRLFFRSVSENIL